MGFPNGKFNNYNRNKVKKESSQKHTNWERPGFYIPTKVLLNSSSVGIDLLPSITQTKTHRMSEAECDLKTSEGKFDPIIIQYSLSIFIF